MLLYCHHRLLTDLVSPRPKTQPVVYIVTCTSGLGSCQVECKVDRENGVLEL